MHRRALAILLACVGLALGACGADPDEARPDARATTTAPAERTPEETVERWVGALRAGDTDTAWDLTHPASREAIGGREAFDAQAPELAEGYGASGDADFTAVPVATEAGPLTIVVLRGTSSHAVPVRSDDGRLRVDPFHDLTSEAGLEVHPEPGTGIEPDARFEVYVAGGREVALVVDDEQVATTSESADGDRQHVTAAGGELAEGPHHLTVVVVLPDGRAQARTFAYTVAATSCGQVAFTPDSEDAASDITASGVSCEDARAFVEVAGAKTSAGGPEQVDVEGYRCRRTAAEEDPLPRSEYECTKADVRITFVRS